jgi:oligosaccharide repeat unit polymerase
MRIYSKAPQNQPAWIICLLPITFWLIASLTGSDILATCGASLGSGLALNWWYRLLNNPRDLISFLKVGGISLVLIVNLSWLVAIYFNVVALDTSISDTLKYDIGTSTSEYSLAISYTHFFGTVLSSLGEIAFIKKVETSVVNKLLFFKSIPNTKLLVILSVFTILELILINADIISYRGYNIEGYIEGNIPWYIPLLEKMFGIHILLNGIALSQLMYKKLKGKSIKLMIILISFLVLFFIFFTKGRTSLVSCVLLHFIWLCFFYGKIPNLKIIIPTLIAIIPMLVTGSMVNTFMRTSNNGIKENIREVSIMSIMNESLDNYFSNKGNQQAESLKSAYNLSTRPLIANPLGMSMALPSDKKEFMLGKNLISGFIWALPGNIVDKSSTKNQEELFFEYFPVNNTDIADSIYLYAYMDFSYIGLIIYPLILASFWLLSLWLTKTVFAPSVSVLIIVSGWLPMFSLTIGESSITTWLTNFRNIIFLVLFLIPLNWLLKNIKHTQA